MLKPLTQFICDTCGEVINQPSEGWIEWLAWMNDAENKFEAHSFKIVHHHAYSPLVNNTNNGCYQHDDAIAGCAEHLHQFIDENYKTANLLMFLDAGPYDEPNYNGPMAKHLREYIEFVRRLTIPYYEEARLYWNEALAGGYFAETNETRMYGVDNLLGVIKRYGG